MTSSLNRIRQATEVQEGEARKTMHRLLASTLGSLVFTTFAFGISGNAFVRGFGVAVLASMAALSLLTGARWLERRRLAVSVLAALSTNAAQSAIDAARTETQRIVSLYRLAQKLALLIGTVIAIGGVVLDGPFLGGIVAGAVLALLVEQVLDHNAEVRAERYASSLDIVVAAA
jgi:hypothetical protein